MYVHFMYVYMYILCMYVYVHFMYVCMYILCMYVYVHFMYNIQYVSKVSTPLVIFIKKAVFFTSTTKLIVNA